MTNRVRGGISTAVIYLVVGGLLTVLSKAQSNYKDLFTSFFGSNPEQAQPFLGDAKYVFVGSFYHANSHKRANHIPNVVVFGSSVDARTTAAVLVDEVLQFNAPKYKAILACKRNLLDINSSDHFLRAKQDQGLLELWYFLPDAEKGSVIVQKVNLA